MRAKDVCCWRWNMDYENTPADRISFWSAIRGKSKVPGFNNKAIVDFWHTPLALQALTFISFRWASALGGASPLCPYLGMESRSLLCWHHFRPTRILFFTCYVSQHPDAVGGNEKSSFNSNNIPSILRENSSTKIYRASRYSSIEII